MEISEIFKRINQSGLNYVLFTGNTGIQNSINGTSDFDILVSKKDGHAFEKMMLDIGVKEEYQHLTNSTLALIILFFSTKKMN